MSRSYSRSLVHVHQRPLKSHIKAATVAKERAEVRQALRAGRDPRPRRQDLWRRYDVELEVERGVEACWRWVRRPEQVSAGFERRVTRWYMGGREVLSEEWLMPTRWKFGK
jgi:hypothetical protein